MLPLSTPLSFEVEVAQADLRLFLSPSLPPEQTTRLQPSTTLQVGLNSPLTV